MINTNKIHQNAAFKNHLTELTVNLFPIFIQLHHKLCPTITNDQKREQ